MDILAEHRNNRGAHICVPADHDVRWLLLGCCRGFSARPLRVDPAPLAAMWAAAHSADPARLWRSPCQDQCGACSSADDRPDPIGCPLSPPVANRPVEPVLGLHHLLRNASRSRPVRSRRRPSLPKLSARLRLYLPCRGSSISCTSPPTRVSRTCLMMLLRTFLGTKRRDIDGRANEQQT